ncbi:hypothetical protein [Maribellus mangrovi]|uniref:hypothetical protein n=1 Tax=Maribellus mangrovi TaxID=3133146 RepID=UPI0030EE13C4
MFYKTFMLVVAFSLMIGLGNAKAQCECIDDIATAVEEVMATDACDAEMMWEAPHALEVHLKKLQNWCGDQHKPLKSKVPNIVAGMLETIQDAYEGEVYVDPLTGMEIVVHIPAPECAIPALQALEDLLTACPVVE